MRTDGPEFRNGWRERYEIDGVQAVVEARHFTRSRLPTPHEYVLQTMRGRGAGMVDAPVHEWVALLSDGRLGRGTIRPTPSGLFGMAGASQLHDTIEAAVRHWAVPIIARAAEARRRQTEEATYDHPVGPRP